jgi:fibronectin-binding autotransporter adhesin
MKRAYRDGRLLRLVSGLVMVLTVAVLPFAGTLASGPSSNLALNYQARITDSNGIPIDGTKNIKFVFYDASTAGNCEYTAQGTCGTPTAKSVTINSGSFSTVLGESTDNAMPDGLFSGDEERWMEIQVETTTPGTYETLSPRKRIVSQGFAFNANLLDDLDTSAVGGSTAFVPVTDANGNFTLTRDVDFAANTFFVDATNSRVGIGTASPSALLTVNQPVTAQGSASSGTATVEISAVTDGSNRLLNLQNIWDRSTDGGIGYGVEVNSQSAPTNGNNPGTLTGIIARGEHMGSGTAGNVYGLFGAGNAREGGPATTVTGVYGSGGANTTSGPVVNAYGVRGANTVIGGSTSITNSYALAAQNPSFLSSGTIDGSVGLLVEEMSGATNNVNVLLGTATIPTTQDYNIYSASTRLSYFAGDLTVAGNDITAAAGGTANLFADSSVVNIADAADTLNLAGGSGSTGCTINSSGDLTCSGSISGSGSGFATTALDNLASVAINTSLIPDSDDDTDLGSSTLRWRDLYLGPASLHIGTDGNEAVISYDTSNNQLEFDPDGDGTEEIYITDAGAMNIAGSLTVNGSLIDGSSNQYFVDGGNTFGGAASLGTNDAYGLSLETGGNTRLSLGATGDIVTYENIEPDTASTLSLGTASVPFAAVYADEGYFSGNSLYMNGKKIIGSSAPTLSFTADTDQNMQLQTSGSGNLQFTSSGAGNVQLTSSSTGDITLSSNDLLQLSSVGNATINASGGSAQVQLSAGEEIDLAATTIDLNGTVNISSLTASQLVLTDASKNLTSVASLSENLGGTGVTSYAAGDILYADGSNSLATLGATTDGYVLTLASGVPTWAAATGGVSGWTDDGAVVRLDTAGDSVSIGTASTGAKLWVLGDTTTEVSIGAQAVLNQTADLLALKNSSGFDIFTVDQSGDVYVGGDLTLNGNDLVTSSGTVNIAAAGTTVNLAGGSGSTGCTINSSGDLTCTGAISGSGGDFATKALDNLASVAINTHLIPDSNDDTDLGSTSLRWQDLYLGAGSAHIGTSASAEGLIGYTDTTQDVFTFSTDGTGNADIAFFTDDLYLDKSSGDIGIATDTPGARLDITDSTTGGNKLLQVSDSSASGSYIAFADDTSVASSFMPSIVSRQIGTGTGRVGLLLASDLDDDGTDDYGFRLLARADGGTVSNADLLRVQNNSTDVFVIDAAGYVGIGDTSPTALLTVGDGDDFKVDTNGNVTTNSNLTVNGNTTIGNASGDGLTINANTASMPNGLTLSRSTSGGDTMLFIHDSTTTNGGIKFTDDTSNSNTYEPAITFIQDGTSGARHGALLNSILNEDTSDDVSFRFYAQQSGNNSIDAANLLQFEEAPSSTVHWVIDHAGNFGIGDTSPSATLTVGDGDLFQVAGATGNVTTSGDVAVNGGDLTTTATTASLFNTNATTLNIGGAATTLNLAGGSGSTGCSIDGSGDLNCAGGATFGSTTVDPDSYDYDTLIGNINDGGGFSAYGVAVGDETLGGYGAFVANNGYFWLAMQDGSSANSMAGIMVHQGSTRYTWFPNGNVGIGDTTPASLFTVGDGDDFQVDTTGNMSTTGTVVVGNTSLDPDSYTDKTIIGAIADGAWGVQGIAFGDDGTGAYGAIGANNDSLFLGMQDGTSASTMATVMQHAGATRLTTFPNGNVQINNDLAVDGGDLTTSASTFNLAASASTVNLAGGSGSTGCTINSSGDLTCTGAISGSGGGFATKALDNLASVAINTHLIPDSNDDTDLGSTGLRWQDLYLGPGSLHVGTSATDEAVISYDTTGNILNIGTDATSNGDTAFNTNDIYIDKSDGSVAIGTTTAGAEPLYVRSSDTTGNISTLVVDNSGGTNGVPVIELREDDTEMGQLIGHDADVAGLVDGLTIHAPTGKNIGFRINTTEIARFNSSGYLGIGDSSPASPLTVGDGDDFQVGATGNVSTTGSLSAGSSAQFQVTTAGNLSTSGTTSLSGITGVGTTAVANIPLYVHSGDTTGNNATMVLNNPGTTSGLPYLDVRVNNVTHGQLLGHDTAAFGLVDGITLGAASGKSVGFRVGTTSVGDFDSSGNLSVTGGIDSTHAVFGGTTLDPDSYSNGAIIGNIVDGGGFAAYGIAFGDEGTGGWATVGANNDNFFIGIQDGTSADSMYGVMSHTASTQLTNFPNGNVQVTNDLAVNGGDLTTTAGTFNLVNTNATTVNIGGAATTLNLAGGSGSTGCTIDGSGNLGCSGTVSVSGYATTALDNLASVAINTDLIPDSNDDTALGSTSLRWSDLYLGAGSAHIGTSASAEGIISYTDTTQDVFSFSTDATGNADIAFFGDDLYIDKSAGRVGVNDTGPDATFDVNGSLYAGSTDQFRVDTDGDLTFVGASMQMSRATGSKHGISWYQDSYNSWAQYMALAGQASVGPNAALTAPSGTLVTSWAMRSVIEPTAGYGWTFEEETSTGTAPTVKFEIRSSDGSARSAGDIAVDGGDLTTTATTASLFNTNATTLNVGGAATTLNLAGGSGSTGCSIDGSGNLACSGTLTSNGAQAFVQGGNSFGASASLGTNDENDLHFETNGTSRAYIDSDGHINLDNYTFYLNASSNYVGVGGIFPQTTFHTNGTIGFGDATARGQLSLNGTDVVIGNEQGSVRQRVSLVDGGGLNDSLVTFNYTDDTWSTDYERFTFSGAGNLVAAGDIAANGGDLTTTAATASLFNTNATTLNVGGAATTLNLAGGSGSTGCTIDGSGNLSCSGTVSVSGYATTALDNLASVAINTDLIPDSNDDTALGSASLRWSDIYLGAGSAHIGTSASAEGIISYTDTTQDVFSFSTDATGNADIAFFTDELYLDKSASHVGIGLTDPDYRLDVSGDFNLQSETFTYVRGTAAGNLTLTANGNITIGTDGGTDSVTIGAGNTENRPTTIKGGPININANTGYDVYISDYVGIGDSSPASWLTVGNGDKFQVDGSGNLDTEGYVIADGGFFYDNVSSPISQEITRTIPTTVNDYVEIGDFYLVNGAHNFRINVNVASSSFASAKTYDVVTYFNATGSSWEVLTPSHSTGPYSGQDYEIDIKMEAHEAALRLRRTSGSTAGVAKIRIESLGSVADVFSEASGTGSTTAPSAQYGVTHHDIRNNRFGIADLSPDYTLDVDGSFAAGTSDQLTIGTTGNLTTSGDVAVNGGDLTTTATTASLFNTNATTLNVGGAATTLNLAGGSGSTGCTIDGSGNLSCSGSIAEADTLATVTGRGATTSTATSFTGGLTATNAGGANITITSTNANVEIDAVGEQGFNINSEDSIYMRLDSDNDSTEVFQILNGSGSTAVSINETGQIGTGVWQASTIEPSYGGTGTATQFTQGSVVFAGASGVYSQDNSGLFFDSGTNELGIGTNAPEQELHVEGDVQFGNSPDFYSDDGSFYFHPTNGNLSTNLNLFSSGIEDKSQLTLNGDDAGSLNYTRLDLFQDGTDTYFRNQAVGSGSNGDIIFQHDGSTRMTIGADGNITTTGNLSVTGNTRIGVADTTQGVLSLSGSTTTEGGEIALDLAADSDGTFNHYVIDTYQDDLRFFPSNAAYTNVMTAEGQLQLPAIGSGTGVLIGGDTQLYRSAANVLTTPDSLTVAGNVTLGDSDQDSITFNADVLTLNNSLNIDNNTLYIDSANNRVGVGKYPGTTFDVAGAIQGSNGLSISTSATNGASITTSSSGTSNVGLYVANTGSGYTAHFEGGAHSTFGQVYMESTSTGSDPVLRLENLNYASTNTIEPMIEIYRDSSGTVAAGMGASIEFTLANSGNYAGGYIAATKTSTSFGSDLRFATSNTSGSDVERLIIDEEGDVSIDTDVLFVDASGDNVGIGNAAPKANFDLDVNDGSDGGKLQVGRNTVFNATTNTSYINWGDGTAQYVYIGETTADDHLDLYGNRGVRLKSGIPAITSPTALCYGNSPTYGQTYTLGACTSTRDKKTNISPLNTDIETILQLEPMSFNYRDFIEQPILDQDGQPVIGPDGKALTETVEVVAERLSVGFIAEDVEPLLPEVITYDDEGDILGLDYRLLTAHQMLLLHDLYDRTLKLDSVGGSTFEVPARGTADDLTLAYDSASVAFIGSAWDSNASAATARELSLSNRVIDKDTYRLSLSNSDNEEVVYFGSNGDVALRGRMFLSDQGAIQTDKYMYLDSTAASGEGRIMTNAAGWGVGSYDFAETFPSVEALQPGELVMFDVANEENIKRAVKDDISSFLLAGIVSTKPGFLAGIEQAGHFPMALAGRVPTRVSAENGAINIGDPITISSTPGVGMKALEPGYVVGIALESYDGTEPVEGEEHGLITVYVRTAWFNGSGVESNNNVSGDYAESQLSNSVLTSNLDVAGYALVNVGAISGLDGLWQIDGNGNMVVQEVTAEEVKAKAITVEQTDEAEATGEGTILVGNSTVAIDNPMVKPNSRIFITFYGNVEGGWWISQRVDGRFEITLQNVAGTDIPFEYLIINVLDSRTPVEPDPEEEGAFDDSSTAGTTDTTTDFGDSSTADTPDAPPAEEPPVPPVPASEGTVSEPPAEDPPAEEVPPAEEPPTETPEPPTDPDPMQDSSTAETPAA